MEKLRVGIKVEGSFLTDTLRRVFIKGGKISSLSIGLKTIKNGL